MSSKTVFFTDGQASPTLEERIKKRKERSKKPTGRGKNLWEQVRNQRAQIADDTKADGREQTNFENVVEDAIAYDRQIRDVSPSLIDGPYSNNDKQLSPTREDTYIPNKPIYTAKNAYTKKEIATSPTLPRIQQDQSQRYNSQSEKRNQTNAAQRQSNRQYPQTPHQRKNPEEEYINNAVDIDSQDDMYNDTVSLTCSYNHTTSNLVHVINSNTTSQDKLSKA